MFMTVGGWDEVDIVIAGSERFSPYMVVSSLAQSQDNELIADALDFSSNRMSRSWSRISIAQDRSWRY
jgi:hypothetical protein